MGDKWASRCYNKKSDTNSRYRTSLERLLQRDDIIERMTTLGQLIDKDGFCALRAAELEHLESLFTQHRLEAERKCRNIRTVPWSPELKAAQATVRFWKMWLSQEKNGIDFNTARDNVWPEGNTTFIKPSHQTIQRELKVAQHNLYDVLLNATKLRQEHLERRAKMVEGRTDHLKALQQIIRGEKMREINKRLGRIFKKNNKSGLSYLLVDDGTGGHKTVDDPEEINAHLLTRNQLHFSQADGTPFTTAPLVDTFGPYGTNRASHRLLKGTFDVDNLAVSSASKSILRALRQAIPTGTIRSNIAPLDMRNGKRCWRETTSVSPSGLHLGHDKALFKMEPHRRTDDSSPTLSDQVFTLQAEFVNRAIRHGHVYQRWRNVVNATIEKIPGKPLVEKLRVIHIIESDMNLTFGILFGRRMMAAAEKHKVLGEEQFGSRAEKTSLTPLLAKYCKYAIARLTKAHITSFDNDAKSCFDRIVMLLASLCAQRLGMDPKVCELLLKTLDATKYKVKTRHGISRNSYSTTKTTKIHGPGQGGRASPGIWAIISCLLMECVRENSDGITMASPDLNEIIQFFTNGFVDDITLWTGNLLRSLQRSETPAELITEMQIAAQWWEQLLYATGGKLELQKCFYYLIIWAFDDEGVASLATIDPHLAEIKLTDSATGQDISIGHRSSTTAHKTLGVMLTPSGCHVDEFKRIYSKARGIGQIVRNTILSPLEAELTLNTRVYPAITYGLAVGALTEPQSHKIQSLFVRPLIRSMGFNMNTPLSVVYASPDVGGVGCKHVFAEQGRMKVSLILQQIRMKSQTGDLAVAFLKWAQLVAGVSTPILESPAISLPHLQTEQFIVTLRQYLTVSRLGIHIPGISSVQPRRTDDHMIMDLALARRPKLTNRTIERINRCRLFLGATHISDLANADGSRLCKNAIACDVSARVHTDSLWPNQPHVGKIHRNTWRWFLLSLCKYRSASHTLLEPLGGWLDTPGRRPWSLYYDDVTQHVYARYNDQWLLGHITDRTTPKWRVHLTDITIEGTIVDANTHKQPVSFHLLDSRNLIMTPPAGNSKSWPAHRRMTYPRTYINTLPESDRDVLRHCIETQSHAQRHHCGKSFPTRQQLSR